MTPLASYHVCYFGLLAERRGLSEERLQHSAATAAELYASLDAEHRLGLSTRDVRAVVNDEFVAWNHPLKDGDRIALLPPMSGG
ncbi:MAG: MoaD/ThiS family protein [Verrucomicrobiota bacterium]